MTFFDTADSYGPEVAEDLLREALHPYADDVVIATKAGLTRQGPGVWTPVGNPAYLRQQCELSPAPPRRRADRPVPAAPHRPRRARRGPGRRAQEAPGRGQDPAHRALRGQRRAARGGPQDRHDRDRAEPLQPRQPRRRAAARPLRAATTSASSRGSRWPPASCPRQDGPLAEAAQEHDATPSQLALAWLLKRSPVMLPIPGT